MIYLVYCFKTLIQADLNLRVDGIFSDVETAVRQRFGDFLQNLTSIRAVGEGEGISRYIS